MEVGQETAEYLHKKVSQACAKNSGGGEKEGRKPTAVFITLQKQTTSETLEETQMILICVLFNVYKNNFILLISNGELKDKLKFYTYFISQEVSYV
jgi:hypothetical protein